MKGYLIPLTCPRCGRQCEPVTEGRPYYAGGGASAVARCLDCGSEWHIMVRLFSVAHEGNAAGRQRRYRAKVTTSA